MEWCSTYFGSNKMSKSGLNRTGVAVFSRKYSCMRFTVQYSSGPQTPCFIGRCYKDCRLFTSELELELIQTHKTQKLVLRVEVGACWFAQQKSTAKRKWSSQLVERPSMRRWGCRPLLALLAASRTRGALAAPLFIAPFSSLWSEACSQGPALFHLYPSLSLGLIPLDYSITSTPPECGGEMAIRGACGSNWFSDPVLATGISHAGNFNALTKTLINRGQVLQR